MSVKTVLLLLEVAVLHVVFTADCCITTKAQRKLVLAWSYCLPRCCCERVRERMGEKERGREREREIEIEREKI